MSIKKHLMIEYARRKNVSSPRHWEVSREAVSDLCQCLGYPKIEREWAGSFLAIESPQVRISTLNVKKGDT
jgi:hypothetical protein